MFYIQKNQLGSPQDIIVIGIWMTKQIYSCFNSSLYAGLQDHSQFLTSRYMKDPEMEPVISPPPPPHW